MAYQIEFSPVARDHLRGLTKRDQQIVIDAVAEQLAHPWSTPRRKRLDENPIAPWELRIGDFRVFYEIGKDKVVVLAVGTKMHNRLMIGGEEIEL